MKQQLLLLVICISLISAVSCTQISVDILDKIDFTSPENNTAIFSNAEITTGVNRGIALRLLTPDEEGWEGGSVRFIMKVDPKKQNYFTARFSGDEYSSTRLILFVDGKQIGYRHLGDWDNLYYFTNGLMKPGGFFYVTTAIPLTLTQDKKTVEFEIRSTGKIARYGNTFEDYQQTIKEPSAGIYTVYTHLHPTFEIQQESNLIITNEPVRPAENTDVLFQEIKNKVNIRINELIANPDKIVQKDLAFLARAWHVNWTIAYQNPQVVQTLIKHVDKRALNFGGDPLYENGDSNPDWSSFAMSGCAIVQLQDQLVPYLDHQMTDLKGNRTTRRALWADMMKCSLDFLRTHRRQYTNQTLIIDINAHTINRSLHFIDPLYAIPLERSLSYLYQAVGLEPWMGNDHLEEYEAPMGSNYYQFTSKGLSKELGYVGGYGEIQEWIALAYLATCEPGDRNSGDKRILEQLIKLQQARSIFRYPLPDNDGYRAMRLETVIGWRDTSFPGDVIYGERIATEGSAIFSAALTCTPEAIGIVQQMFEDNQFEQSCRALLARGNNAPLLTTLMFIPDDYDLIKKELPQQVRLPMSEGEPDFVFSDEENGVLALKNGDEILYASLYWRAYFGVNNLAQVHHITPSYDRIATVRTETVMDDSGLRYTRPEWVNLGFAGFREWYDGVLSAHTGEILSIARIPDNIPYKIGMENSYAGKALFYKLQFDDYIIIMNCSADQTFPFKIPAKGYIEIPSRKEVKERTIQLSPMSTKVFYRQ